MKARLEINAADNAAKFPIIVYIEDDNGRMLDFRYFPATELSNEVREQARKAREAAAKAE